MGTVDQQHHREISKLRDRVEGLEGEVAYWRGLVIPADDEVRKIKIAFARLAPMEAKLLWALASGRCVSDDQLCAAIGAEESMNLPVLLAVHISRIRFKLSFQIERYRFVGYRLMGDGVATVQRALKGPAA